VAISPQLSVAALLATKNSFHNDGRWR
jgi:hypothetical protein